MPKVPFVFGRFLFFSYFWPSSGTENNPLLDEWSRGVTRGLRGKPNKNAWSTRIYAQAHGERERVRGERGGKERVRQLNQVTAKIATRVPGLFLG